MILHLNVCGGGKHRHAHSQSLVSGVQGESSLQWSYPGIWNMAVSEYRQWGWEIYRARRELEITNPTNNTDANRCGGTWPNKVWHLWFMMFLRMALGQICQLKRACAKQKWHSFGAHRYSLPWLMHTTSGDRFHMLNAPVGLFWSFLGHDAFRGPWQGNQRSGHKSEPAQGWILPPKQGLKILDRMYVTELGKTINRTRTIWILDKFIFASLLRNCFFEKNKRSNPDLQTKTSLKFCEPRAMHDPKSYQTQIIAIAIKPKSSLHAVLSGTLTQHFLQYAEAGQVYSTLHFKHMSCEWSCGKHKTINTFSDFFSHEVHIVLSSKRAGILFLK
jgi:hypothetical protein